MSVYRWIHLTDLHLGMDGQSHLWPNVEDIFLNDLDLLKNQVGTWDLVVFTGDLTQCGSKEEFEQLEKLLQKLWSHFEGWGFQPKLLAIPGNHDLVRPNNKSDLALISLLRNWSVEEVQKPFWDDVNSPQRQLVSTAFENFTTWWETTKIPKPTNIKTGILPGDWSASLEADGFSIGVLGLNSAFLHLDGGDFTEKLHLDVRQFHDACGGSGPDWIKQHDTCLLLTHHPVCWLSKDAKEHFDSEIHAPPKRFGLHLFGHMHEPTFRSIALGGGEQRRGLQGSSLFGLETWGENEVQRKHGYSLGELRLENEQLQLRIWPRRAIQKPDGSRKLERDTQAFHLEEGDGGTIPQIIARIENTATEKKEKNPSIPITAPTPAASYDPRNPVFHVPFRPKGNQVIGREEALQRVREQLTAGRRTAIGQTAVFQGLGGLGKTQLAVEYAYRYRNEYPSGVIWLTADQDLDAQLTELAVKARWVAPESDHSIKLQVARHRLRTISDCLIIFDNLEDPVTISNYLPEAPAEPHLLATSRTEQPDFNYLPIELLTPEQSIKLLVQEARREPEGQAEQDAASAIAQKLAGLPLAIELAGAYLARRPVSYAKYRDLLQSNLKKALPPRFSSLTNHEADLYSTLQISDEIFDEEPLLRPLLDLLTWSAPAPMGIELISALLSLDNPTDLTGALGLGVALRILQQSPDSERYAIHRLLQEVRREQLPLANRAQCVEEISFAMGDWFETLRKDFTHLPNFEAEIDHLQTWHDNALEFAPQQAARLTWLQAYPSSHRSQFGDTQKTIEQALEEYKRYHCDTPELLAHLYSAQAFVLGAFGDFNQALALAHQAFEIRRNLFNESHPDVAESLSNIASYTYDLGDPKQALNLAQQALEIQRDLFGEQHPDFASTLGNIASYTADLGDPKQALNLAQYSLEIRRDLFGEQHPNIANSLNNIAHYTNTLGDPKQALTLTQQALQIRRDLFGEQHPDVANSLSNIAGYTDDLGDPKQALNLAQQALQIRRDLFGEQHPDFANSLSNIAYYTNELGDPKQALTLAQQALDIRRDLFGEQHPDFAISLHNIAGYLLGLGKTTPAFEHATKAHAIYKKIFGPQHSRTKGTAKLLAQIKRPGFRIPGQKNKAKSKRGKKKRR